MSHTIQVGMAAPVFSLSDIYGKMVSLDQYRGRPLILVFIRHLGCLLSRTHLSQLRAHYGKIQHLGGEVIVVSFEDKERLKGMIERHKLPFVVLLDPGKKTYNEYGMVYRESGSTGNLKTALSYLRLRLSGYPKQQQGHDTRQMGGDAVIDREGVVRFIYCSQYPHDLPLVDDLLQVMSELGR